ncbi:hypothetical protein ACQPZF_32475 [Actinosynnema sp. CS-041913]
MRDRAITAGAPAAQVKAAEVPPAEQRANGRSAAGNARMNSPSTMTGNAR